MYYKIFKLAIVLSAILGLVGCSIKDIENPNITEQAYLTGPDAAASWVNGIKRQIAFTMNEVVVSSELVSDNYFNNRTLSSKVFDIPQIDNFDLDVTNMQRAIHRLREMSVFGLDKVVAADPKVTNNQKAEMNFGAGLAHLLLGELFVAQPIGALGAVASQNDHINLAITYFNEAIQLQSDANTKLAYQLMRARAWYRLGNATNAVADANAVLVNPSLLFNVRYDGINGVSNLAQNFLFSATANEFAPLPRLDFLDPKYFHIGTVAADQKPIAVAKAEEAYLIIAEAAISANQLTAAKTTLKNMLTNTVANRPVVSLDDSRETRNGGNRNDYPVGRTPTVKFDAESTPKSGYVLNRQGGNIQNFSVSGTKVTAAEIDAANTQDEMLYLLYLLRQEIFFAEGRRMTDLGILFPIALIESDNNPNVLPEHKNARIPAYIPLDRIMDDFTFDAVNNVVTMRVDMNRILVANKSNPAVFPFIN